MTNDPTFQKVIEFVNCDIPPATRISINWSSAIREDCIVTGFPGYAPMSEVRMDEELWTDAFPFKIGDITVTESSLRCWFNFTGEPRENLISYFGNRDYFVESMIQTWMGYKSDPEVKERARIDPPYSILYECIFLKFEALVPYYKSSLDVVLSYGKMRFQIHLEGVKNRFFFQVYGDLDDNFLVKPHPNVLNNMGGTYSYVALFKYIKKNQLYLLTRLGSQPILIPLDPNNEFTLVYGYIEQEV